MATIDLSRSVTDYRKHYSGVGAQMGRVLTDDDHNDNERIHGEDLRRSRLDVIGPAGSPDTGFSIDPVSLVITATTINFDILPGTFYLGGNRLTLENTEKFLSQSDWLDMLPADLPPVPTALRNDLVYLECWQQPVAAVEDSELFEVALGGPDTGTRMRIMRRVHVLAGVAAGDCATDWATLTSQWAAAGLGTLDANCELKVNTTLTVAFVPGPPGDLCTPAIAGGYLGAENQAIRVQLVDSASFTWGFDNAAPLYRVTVGPNGLGQPRIITLQTEPKDQAHWPVSGQIVEFLACSALLSNQEKTAEVSGQLAVVDASYDPDTQQLSVTTDVSATFGTAFFYMRVWNRGSDTASPPAIPFVNGTPVTLGNTGLSVTFAGSDHHPDDFWIIAARPESPNLVVPWQLYLGGRGPNGIRRWYAPLAELQWTPGGGGVVIHDCRDIFPPLTRLDHCCCKVTVGDGISSFGDFTQIQDAIDALPTDGGEVCIRPGTYRQNFIVKECHDVKIHGCGSETILLDGGNASSPIITVLDSQRIQICNLTIEAPAVIGILLDSTTAAQTKNAGNRDITLDHLQMLARDLSAIECLSGQGIVIEHNEINAGDLSGQSNNPNAGMYALVFVRADDVLVERNQVRAAALRALVRPLGGLQIGGGSERVAVRRNLIEGGNGNGVTLGSITYQDPGGGTGTPGTGGGWTIDPNGCIVPVNPTGPTGPNGPLTPVSDGNLLDIRIIDNDILQMGQSGISTLRFFDAGIISVRRLQIELNRIRRCVQLELGGTLFAPPLVLGFGGVTLVAVEQLTARDNFIEDCGRSYIDPICGIYVLIGRGIVAEGNQILNNGARTPTGKQPTSGPRGGIIIESTQTPMLGIDVAVQGTGFPAARISSNTVVVPLGRALQIIARGLVSVNDNELTSCGVERAAAFGVTVLIFNVGVTYEIGQFTGFANMGLNQPNNGLSSAGRAKVIVGGEVLFNDNQVLLVPADAAGPPIFSSVELVSIDDVQFDDNQCEARVGRETLIANGFALAWSVRMNSNRFEEALTPGVSGFSIGLFNCTALNQGTRCFAAIGNATLLEVAGNKSLTTLLAVNAGLPDPCAILRKLLAGSMARFGLSA